MCITDFHESPMIRFKIFGVFNSRCRRTPECPEADWKPSAHKCLDRGSNPGLIGTKQGKIRCADLLAPPPPLKKKDNCKNYFRNLKVCFLMMLQIPRFFHLCFKLLCTSNDFAGARSNTDIEDLIFKQ